MPSTEASAPKSPLAGDVEGGGRDLVATAKHLRDRYAALVGFGIMVAIFWILEPSTFGTWDNFKAILSQAAPTVVLAVGLTVVLTTNAYDLSFTGVIALASVAGVLLMRDSGAGTFIAVAATLGVGAVVGLIAGGLVALERASSFIVTLALGTVLSAFAIGFSDGQNITDMTEGYLNITLNEVFGIPNAVIIALVVSIVAWAMLRFTVFGRQAQSIGSNQQAARLAGIRISATRIGAFLVMGICAAIAAVLLTSSTGGFNPSIGAGLFIPPFVAAFFGIAVLAAGRFNVFGTVVGALFMGTLQTGLVIIGTEAWVGNMVVGLSLLVILMLATGRGAGGG